MKINVTSQHIREGKRDNSRYCPIALALKEQIPGVWVEVFYDFARLQRGLDPQISLDLPVSAKRFIKKFDKRKKAKPFNFVINLE